MKLKPIFVARFILLAVLPCQSALGQVPSENPDITLQKGITIEGSANEGEELTLSLPGDAIAGGSGNSENYSYRWEYRPRDRSQLLNPNLQLSDPTTRTLTVTIPANFIGRDYTSSTVVFTMTVGEAGSTASTESIVTIIKQPNFVPTLDVNLKLNSNISGTTASITAVVNSISDADGDGEFTYSWQSLALSDTQWRDVKTETTTRTLSAYTVPEGTTPTIRYRVELSYTDAQGYTVTEQFGTYRTDVDIDDDRLIEIYYLEDLDAIRYRTDGSGYQPTLSDDIDLNSSGCDEDGTRRTCDGYEIARHLDFGNDAHYQDLSNKATWTEGAGWSPIDSLATALEGNGNTISGLRIVRNQGGQGLFRQLRGSSGIIRNLGLLGVNINIMSSGIAGGFAGSLGIGIIRNSYVKGTIVGNQEIGGFAGNDLGQIINSYANVNIQGRLSGGLYGRGDARIASSYVTGSVTGLSVGAILSESNSFIENSYAANNLGNIKDNNQTGISNSYARVPSRHNELKEPTGPGTSDPELYIGWRTDRWDFGTSEQFPILKYVEDCSNDLQTERTDPPQCGTFLPDQNNGLRDLEIISEVIELDKVFASEITNYDVSFNDDTPNLTLRLKAYESDSQISVRRHGDSTDYFAGMRSTPDVGDDISLTGTEQTTVTITVREIFPVTETRYTLTLINRTLVVSGEIGIKGDGTITDNVISTTEGRSFTLTAPQVSGGIRTPSYEWTVTPENSSQLLNPNLQLSDTTTQTLTVTIPADFIGRNYTSSTVVFTLTVGDGTSSTVRSVVLKVGKTNNDTWERTPELTADGTKLNATEDIEDSDGNPGENDIGYQWQRKAVDADEWVDIDGATTKTYTILQLEYPITFNYRVGVRYTDRQGYVSDIAYSDPTPADYRPDIDTDDDGLIEVYYLEDLDAIRYQLDGSGYRTSTQARVIKAGCGYNDNGSTVCRGYELIRDLDFGIDNSYSSTANQVLWQPNESKSNEGWVPIGSNSQTTVSAPMLFEGNGYTISNLYQSTATYSGLFGNIDNTGKDPLAIYNIGLLDVDIQTRGGDNGGLAAACRNCLIANSYVTGTLSSEGTVDTLGGLVGRATTTDNNENPQYENVYARVDLIGNALHSGHLLGHADIHINNAYTRGYQREDYEGALVGSLGSASTTGTLINVYATGTKIADIMGDFLIRTSYTTQTVSILKLPTAPGTAGSELYNDWSTDIWDFGTSEQFPILKYVEDCSNDLQTQRTNLPQCGTFLPDQNDGLRDLEIISDGIELDKVFASEITRYDVSFGNETPNLTLRLKAYEGDSQISVREQGDSTDYFAGMRDTADVSDGIPLENVGETTVTITVREVFPATETEYTLSLRNRTLVVSGEIGIAGDETITDNVIATTEGRSFTLTAPQASGGSGMPDYEWTVTPEDSSQLLKPNLVLSSTSVAVLTVRVPANFIGRDYTSSTVVFTLTVGDGTFSTDRRVVLKVNKINNDTPQRDPRWVEDGISLNAIEDIEDPDGNPGDSDIGYQWQRKAIDADEWMDISGASSETYTILQPEYPITFNYRVGVRYTDAQGYLSDIAYSDSTPADYRPDIDTDNDGLIEIYYLEDLDAVRYRLDGSGYRTSTQATVIKAGCGYNDNGSTVCRGYELIRDLDFGIDNSYSSTANKVIWQPNDGKSNEGWVPIGSNNQTTVSAPMLFEGNGYAISNLYQSTATYSGLFGNIDNTGKDPLAIYNIGLLDLDIQTRGGDNGGLAAACRNCLIANSYVTGTMSSEGTVDTLGGLVGRATTTDNNTNPQYENVYARVDLTGNALHSGHLLGHADVRVNNAYARGYQQETYEGALVGSLGSDFTTGTLINVYATGTKIADIMGDSLVRTSYTTRTVSILKSPTAPGNTDSELYEKWTTDNWDFGTSEQYPILRYNSGSYDYEACSDQAPTQNTDQPQCDTFLPDQNDGLRDLEIISDGIVLDEVFASEITNYSVGFSNDTPNLTLRLKAYEGDSQISVREQGDSTDYFAGMRDTADVSDGIPLTGIEQTAVTITVREVFPITETEYTLTLMNRTLIVSQQIGITGDVMIAENVVSTTEGRSFTLEPPRIEGGFGAYRYNWAAMPENPSQLLNSKLQLRDTTNRTLTVTIPENFIGRNDTSSTVVFNLTVGDGTSSTVRSVVLKVNKINNDTSQRNPRWVEDGISLNAIEDIEDPDGNPGDSDIGYQWQRKAIDADEWMDISGASSETYTILQPEYPIAFNYRVGVRYTDAQGYLSDIAYSDSTPADYRPDIDTDNDGLIEIYYLEDLDAVRYQLDGSGYRTSTQATVIKAGCGYNDNGSTVCRGYELIRDLDFSVDSSYSSTANKVIWQPNGRKSNEGWVSIGSNSQTTVSAPMLFEGNGYAISNLYQSTATYSGLFGNIDNTGKDPLAIYNIGLLDLDIQTRGGDNGGLAAACRNCLITNSYVTGTMSSEGTVDTLGGLVGRATTTDNNANPQYENVYARVDLTGNALHSGHLLGHADVRVNNAYARGYQRETYEGALVGSLGSDFTTGTLINVYATGTKIADIMGDSLVRTSYTTRTVSILKSPTAPGDTDSELYRDWAADNWDFGTSEQFPILKYNKSGNSNYIACSSVLGLRMQSTDQPQCGTFLPDQNDGLRDLEIISDGIVLDKAFASEITRYDVSFGNETPNLRLRLKAYEGDSQISVREQGNSTDYFAGMRDTTDVSDDISLENVGETTVTVTVREVFPATETEYTLTLINRTPIVSGEIDIAGDGTITDNAISTTEGRSFTLESPRLSGGSRTYNYRWNIMPEDSSQLLNPNLVLSSTSIAVLTVRVPDDFIGRDYTSSTVVFTLTVGDGTFSTDRRVVLKVNKINNDTPQRNPRWVEDGISLNAIEDIEDADGNPNEDDIGYQWQRKAIDADEWMDISGATMETYTAPPEYPITFNYRVGVSYTDRQGYLNDIAYSEPTPTDYRPDIDIDNDGLIEIYYLEDLDAVRYRLDGSGYRTSTQARVINSGCGFDDNGSTVCRGYELIRDLDFGVDNSYSSTANKVIWQPNDGKSNEGWVSIGSNSQTTVSAPMIFEGNGYAISNLYQSTATYSGLFGNIDNTGEDPLAIYNIGLLDVDIQTRGGDNGGLAAACRNCLIANSYVTGTMSSEGMVDTLGGLVGRATTTDNNANPQYENVYARVDLTGNALHSGHLLGHADVRINNAYARGYQRETYEGALVGSLGSASTTGTLINVYATGTEIADITTNSLVRTAYTTQTVSILKSPTAPGNIDSELYEKWTTDNWDFGTSEQYPILRYNSGSYNYEACSDQAPTKSTDQPECVTFLPDQGIGLRDLNILAPTVTRTDSVFVSDRTEYTLWIRDTEERAQLELNGYDFRGIITIDGVGTATGSTMTTVALPKDTSVQNIIVADAASTAYTLTIIKTADIAGTGEITLEPMPSEDGTVDEGSTIELTSDIVGGDYRWTQPGVRALEILEQNAATITVRVLDDFVAADATTRNTVLTLTVTDLIEGDSRSISRILTIKKIDNGPAEIDFVGEFGNRQLTAIVGDDPDGNATEYRYQWQSRAPDSNSWTPVASTTTALRMVDYQIPADTTTATRYRVAVQYTDAQGYRTDEVAGNYLYRAGDNDDNDNGFIDIYTLEDLAATKSGTLQSRNRYELRRNLDFNDPLSYADTRNMNLWSANDDRSNPGWEPIPRVNGFSSYTFDGNGYTISNLYINRASTIALFRQVNVGSIISNIGLINVDIRGNNSVSGLIAFSGGMINSSYVGGSVKIGGNANTGGLVGQNGGIIADSYVIATSGTIVGLGDNTGGLVGYNFSVGTIRNSGTNVEVRGNAGVGGLIGRNEGAVRNSFARGSVTGNRHIGGLIGRSINRFGRRIVVINSYSTGDVIEGDVGSGSPNLGGLIGLPDRSIGFTPFIAAENSYTISKVIPNPNNNRRIGGLLGNKVLLGENDDTVASYWNSDVYTEGDRRPTDDDETSKTTMELQSPIDAIGIYRQWSTDNWDFGDETTYPMLRYDPASCNLDSDTARCGLLPNQQYETGLGALFLLSNGEVLNPDLRLGNQPFSVLRENYSIGILNRDEVQLRPFAVGGDDAEIKIIRDRDSRNYFSGKSSGQPSNSIPLDLDVATTVSIVVTDGDINTTYTLVMRRYDIETTSTVVDEGDEITLNTSAIGDSRSWSFIPPDSVDILSGQGTATLQVKIPDNFVPGGIETTMATLVFEVNIVDGATTYTPRETLRVNKINNGMPPDISLEVSSTTLSIVVGEGTDSDGEGEFMYTWERLHVENGRKERNEVSTSPEYRLPDTDNGSTRYFVNVTHTDGQGFTTEYADRESFILEPIKRTDIGIDDDDDGLIEIYYLDDLDAIREHLTEMPATCGQNNDQPCEGYELQRSLNFSSNDSYIGEVNRAWISTFTSSPPGWQPIGSIETPFNTVFTAATDNLFIDRLYINRPEEDNIGLFGVIGPRAKILDIQVRDPNISGRYAVGGLVGVTSRLTDSEGSVTESSLIANSSVVFTQLFRVGLNATRAWLGGLVGSNYGSIVNSYTQVRLNGDFAVGGLAGYSFGPISDSYALSFFSIPAASGIQGTDIITAGNAVGGLVGYNHSESPFKGGGSITNSYATNSVLGDFDVGGLVGYNDAGTIDNSYALGHVVGGTNVGGLVGYNSNGTIVGYAGNIVTGANNVGDLVSPESGGTVTALSTTPTLTYTGNFDGNGYSSCVVADGQTDYRVTLPACDTLLPEQDSRIGIGTPALSGVTLSVGTLEPEFDPVINAFSSFNGYEIFDIPENTTKITVTATTNIPNANLFVNVRGVRVQDNVMSSTTRENNSRTISRTIPVDDIRRVTTISIERGSARDYAIVIPAQPKLSGIPRMPCRADTIDRDGDGLIEICDLEGLYAMRYRLDADAMPKTCGERNDSACRGYELVRDLDFDKDESYRNPSENKPIWTTGKETDRGWRPIGNPSNPFNVEFSATTSHSIANLMIDRDFIRNYTGLFGYTGRNARIVNIELSDANVSGRYLTGGLVGRNEGTIINSRVTSASTVTLRNAWGGGLVGDNAGIINDSYTHSDVTGIDQIGGLVGINTGRITNSIAESDVLGVTFAGGLAGVNAGNINNSYASGTLTSITVVAFGATRVDRNFYYAGGLVGLNVGVIADTYSIGNIDGSERVGGLVGDNRNLIASSYAAVGNVVGTRLVGALVGINSGSIIDSYGDQSSRYNLVGENLPIGTIRNSETLTDDMNLQSRSSISGWRAVNWDFGTNMQYPALKYLRSETDPVDCERCGMLLQGQAMRPDFSLRVAEGESATLIETPEMPSDYMLRVDLNADNVRLIPDANIENATIRFQYRVDNEEDRMTMTENRQPFTAMIPSTARTITITLLFQDQNTNELISYRRVVDIHRVIRTQIRLFPEGLLNP